MSTHEDSQLQQVEAATEQLSGVVENALDNNVPQSEIAEAITDSLPEGLIVVAVEPEAEDRALRREMLIAAMADSRTRARRRAAAASARLATLGIPPISR